MSETRYHLVKVLLLLLLCCWLLQTGADTQMWDVMGSPNAIEGREALGGERQVRSKTQCGMMASVIPNAFLFCFTTPDVCTMYDYKMGATRNTSSSGGQKTCYRWFPYACDVEGELLVNDDCSISQCQHNLAQLYEGSLAPLVTFDKLVAKNCIHMELIRKDFAAARLNCQALGGDLYVPGDFQGMRSYIMTHYSSYSRVILGGWAQKWLDGRTISSSEWDDNQPSGNGNAIHFWNYNNMTDDSADNPHESLCQKGVSYP